SGSGTRKWIEERNEYSPFGFAGLCEYLGLDPDWVRRGLTRWMDNVDNGSLDTAKSNDGQSTAQSFKTRMPHISPLRHGNRFSSQPTGKKQGSTAASTG